MAAHNFSIVTGGAGCGKTTVLKCIFDVLDEQGYQTIQMALSGKAVKRIIEATNRPAQTLARFIKNGPPACKVAVVIDEASMVDLISFCGVISLLPHDAKLVMVGDPHQLPPVGPGLILHCLNGLPSMPHVELKTTNRFGNKLATIANSVRDGELPPLEHFNDEIQFVQTSNAEIARQACALYLEQPENSIVLSATRAIAKSVNLLVQEALSADRKPLKLWNIQLDLFEHYGLYEGDLVICSHNHWELGIQNGSMGRLIKVMDTTEANNTGEPTAIGMIEWDDGEVRPLSEELLDSLELGYAITVHKSQGSQWQRVITCLPTGSRMLDRSLVYTALTRSQKDVLILGDHAELASKIRLQKSADRRRVGLTKRLQSPSPPQ